MVLDRNVPRLRRADDWLQLSLESSGCLVICPHLQVRIWNTVILQKQFRTRICICIWLVNFCFKCWLWHITHMYTRISVITFADFGVLLLEIPVRNTFVEHFCVACHFHLTYPTIFKKNKIIVHLVLRDTPLYCHEFKKCLSTLEDVNPNYLFSQFPLILSTYVCFSYI